MEKLSRSYSNQPCSIYFILQSMVKIVGWSFFFFVLFFRFFFNKNKIHSGIHISVKQLGPIEIRSEILNLVFTVRYRLLWLACPKIYGKDLEGLVWRKTVLGLSKKGHAQTSLPSYRDYLEFWKFVWSKLKYYMLQWAKIKGADQPALLFLACSKVWLTCGPHLAILFIIQ